MSYEPVADTATQVLATAQHLVAELEPTAARLIDRHLAQAEQLATLAETSSRTSSTPRSQASTRAS
jgi:hypothetical protein